MSANQYTSENPVLPAFRRIGKNLQRMAQAMLGSEADAEDALQDAFCRLWTRRENIRSESEAAALLTTTVRNLSIDVLRSRKQRDTTPIEEQPDCPDDEAEAASQREQTFRSVEKIIHKELSPLARDILHRREYDGETIEHIAASLGMQPTAVRMQLSRARKTIRECYLKQNEP